MKLLILLTLLSCATHQDSIQLSPNRDVWVGRSEADVTLHPIFATLPVDIRKASNGAEVRTFKNSGGIVSSNNCTSYQGYWGEQNAGCSGNSYEVVCQHVFTISKNKVANYNRIGNCTEERLEMRPRNEDGSVVFLNHEKDQYRAVSSINSECRTREDCKDGKTCQITDTENQTGVCGDFGLFGKLLYK